jgi:hypothetical protein
MPETATVKAQSLQIRPHSQTNHKYAQNHRHFIVADSNISLYYQV